MIIHLAVRAFLAGLVIALFVPLAFDGRSILGLLTPLALLGIMSLRSGPTITPLAKSLVTPYLPLVLATLAAAPFQETVSEKIALVAFFMVYILARWLRLVLPIQWIALGLASVGLMVGVFRQFSLTDFGANISLLQKIADINGRNPAGMVVGFGLLAAVVALIRYLSHRLFRTGALFLSVILFILLMISDTVAMVVSVSFGLLATGVLSLVGFVQRRPLRAEMRGIAFAVLGGTILSAIIVSAANLAPNSQNGVLSVVRRDFTSFTGRTDIWACYFEAVSIGAERPWEATVACLGWPAAHLHSIFLQSHLLTGFLGASLLTFGLLMVTLFSAIRFLRSNTLEEISEHLFAFVTAVVGLALGLVESYLFTLLLPALVVFMGPEVRKSVRTKLSLQKAVPFQNDSPN